MFITYNSFYFSVHLKLLIINGKRKVEFKQAFINCTNSNIPSTDLGIYKESWAPKDWCFWTMVLEKTLENPLDCKEIQPVHPEGDQSWVFIGRTDIEAETPIPWPPDVKSWLVWTDPDAGKGWGQEEKGRTEDEMVGWHHWLNGHGFGWTPGVGDEQGGLVCCGSWGRKELDTTERLNWFRHWSCSHWFFKFIISFLAAPSSLLCAGFSSCRERGLLSSCSARVSLIAEHRL